MVRYPPSFGDRILYTTATGGENCHGHSEPHPSTSGVKNFWAQGRSFLYTTGADAEISAVKVSMESVPLPLFLGLCQWMEKLAGNLVLKIQTPPISTTGVSSRKQFHELVPEESLSQAHSSLSHRMLCCSLVALLALILCEVLFLPMKKGNSPWQDKPG